MNTQPQALRILCYGDSNIYGRGGSTVDRYPSDVRWTGFLQKKLGEGYEVIEEGLRSRTTNLDDDDPRFPGRNGLTYLRPCLDTHSPLDLVILWLGTNDFKTKFHREAETVAQGNGLLIDMIQTVAQPNGKPAPKILVVSSAYIREEVLKPTSLFSDSHAGARSQQLAPFLQKIAEAKGCAFVDIAKYVKTGDVDGVHFDPDMHMIVAEVLEKEVKKIFTTI